MSSAVAGDSFDDVRKVKAALSHIADAVACANTTKQTYTAIWKMLASVVDGWSWPCVGASMDLIGAAWALVWR